MSKKGRERREKWQKLQEAREIEGLVKRVKFFDFVKREAETARLQNEKIWDAQLDYDLEHGDDFHVELNQEIGETNELGYNAGWIDDAVVIDVSALTLPFAEYWDDRLAIDGESDFVPDDRIVGVKSFPLVVPYEKTFIEWRSHLRRFGVFIFASELHEEREIRLAYEKPVLKILDYACESTVFWDGDEGLENISKDFDIFENTWDDGKDHWWFSHVCIDFALYVFRLIGSRNVVLVDNEPNSIDAQLHERRFGAKPTKYKTLALQVGGKSTKQTAPQQQFDVMPLHGVRAHARHAPEHPIPQFAKPLLIPAHIRGSEKNGVVVKDYKVKP